MDNNYANLIWVTCHWIGMKNCPVCSTPAKEGEKFCGVCGTLFNAHDAGPIRTEPESPGPKRASPLPKNNEGGEDEEGTTKGSSVQEILLEKRNRRVAILQPALLFLLSVILLVLLFYNAVAVVMDESEEVFEEGSLHSDKQEALPKCA